MRKVVRHRFIAAMMAMLLILSVVPAANFEIHAADSELSLDVTCPFGSEIAFEVDGTSVTSNSYRIPAMVTLDDGTIVAAADIRWNTTYDGGGLDTLVARSADGGETWDYTLANYLGDNGNTYCYNSTCFIDPCLTVAADGQTVYMLCDLYPYGIALNGNGSQTTPSTSVGFNSSGYLLLSGDNHSSYGYYLKDGYIYSSSGSVVSGYTVDAYFNLYYNDQLTSNLFYADSPYKVVRTGYLYLTSSTDGGETWSAPTLLNLKTSSEYVCLVGPGRGMTTSDGTMVFPVYSYSGTSGQRTGFIYSTDGVNWERAQCSVSWSSESAVVEIGEGTLRFFYRNGTSALCYVDYDMSAQSWGSAVNTGIATNSNTQLSAITYSKTADGQQVVLVSCPTGPNAAGSSNNNGGYRLNGRIFAGIVNDDGTMTWSEAINVTGTTAVSADTTTPYTEAEGFFGYSCLTERSDGSIALLYENHENAWGTGDDCYYAMNMQAYSSGVLGIEFDQAGDSVTTDTPTNVVSANGVTVSSDTVFFTGLTVTTVTAPTADYIKNAIAYDVIPTTENGVYTGAANVTIAIPEGWDPDHVFGYVKESGGTLTVLAGTASSSGSFTFTTPHFSETGLLETADGTDVSAVTITLEVGETSGAITVSDSANVGTAGTFSTDNVSYTVAHVSQEGATVATKVDSLASDAEIVISDGNGNYLVRNGTSVTVTKNLSEATVWTVGTSRNGYTLYDGDYYLRPRTGRNTYDLNVSEAEDFNTWSYDTSTGFYYDNRYLYYGAGWAVAQNITSGYGAAYGLTVTEAVTTTTVTFTGTDVTTGDVITIGDTTYIVIVNAKTATESKFLQTENTLTLDALTDLGLSGDYTVTYAETADESGAITVSGAQVTAGTATGEATVTAVVTSEEGNTVGTVTYTITVSDIVVEDVKNIYVPVNGTAVIEGLTGEIYTGMFDESIATYAVDASGNITFTGVADGKTSLVVGTTQINVYVNPENTQNTDASKYIYIYVEEIEHCTVYYAINGGTLHQVEGTGVLIDQTYYDGFSIIFFAVPDEGYALTEMYIEGTAGQYYCLSDGSVADGSGSSAWPFEDPEASTLDYAFKSGHGFQWCLREGNMTIAGMRDLFTRALALGADGATTLTKNASEGIETNVSFIAEKLPTLEKTIVSYTRDGVTSNYTDGTTLEFGDVVTYQFTITTYSANIEYSNVQLSDSTIGYTRGDISGDTLATAGRYTYTATYTITSGDLAKYTNGTFVNTAQLTYTYKSIYSTGQYNSSASASVSCKINGIVYYVWMEGLPEGITGDTENYPLPESSVVTYGDSFNVESYEGKTPYVVENGVTVETWTFVGWAYNGVEYKEGDAFTMPNGSSVEFVGIWTCTVAQKYTSLTIAKKFPEDYSMDVNQSFLFKLTDEDGLELTVTVHGNGSVTIDGLTVGKTYRVVEITSWSWRYAYNGVATDKTTVNLTETTVTDGAEFTLNADGKKITFVNERSNPYWLDGDSWCNNIFK